MFTVGPLRWPGLLRGRVRCRRGRVRLFGGYRRVHRGGGAPNGNSGAGTAGVFTRSGSTWPQQARLPTAGGAANDPFGGSVAIAGSTAVMGAPGDNSSTGAAYVFVNV